MKQTVSVILLLTISFSVFAQKKTTTSAVVSFDATTEKNKMAKASNNAVIAVLNTSTGEVAFEAAVKNFSFDNPQMQTHFNGANWFNSDTYPIFSFTGTVTNLSAINFSKNGTYKATVTGTLKIRDVSKAMTVDGKITVQDGKIVVHADFTVALADFHITGQPIEAGNVSREPKVAVNATF